MAGNERRKEGRREREVEVGRGTGGCVAVVGRVVGVGRSVYVRDKRGNSLDVRVNEAAAACAGVTGQVSASSGLHR